MHIDIDKTELEQSVKKFKPIVTLSRLEKLCKGDEVLSDLLREVKAGALRYTESVCRFQQILLKYGGAFDEDGERAEIEKVRGSIHDVFIDDVNILVRNLGRRRIDNSWADAFGGSRARYGQLALTLAFEILTSEEV